VKLDIENQSRYDGRTVRSIVKFAARELEVDTGRTLIKVKDSKYRYGGWFYWGNRVPRHLSGYDCLITIRLGQPEKFPCTYHTYNRRDSPKAWELADWREALASVAAHELMHLRQFQQPELSRNNRGRLNEVETEWAAWRILNRWRGR
jgi:hypothetical protein